ncbi:hypothetical protein BCT30_11875 [Enterovibrio norvegicus]|uniref:hypothetical protein n=1 Tax=Enterovibrio norvegicus TaxID=188144 RepID=UPI000C819C9C|nr:hypothetical protein [Enterovibrio norvegicus]MCC4796578.1 hypothetical protein [Enterovibrio norvegicus]PMI35904.1 hypothetical protein BCU46_16810 [Enterovibrio norvegicus]PMN52976.1 hypothetical protein BCT30_11875 [Enterovibrio norvegicus]
MMHLVRFFTCLLLISIMSLAGCSSASKSVHQYQIPIGTTYKIDAFNFDLSQQYSVAGMLNEKETEALMMRSFSAKLEKEGLLATDENKGALPLVVNIDYFRNYVGQATPFRTEMVSPPKLYYSIEVIDEKGEKKTIFQSQEMTTSARSLFYLGIKKNIKEDVTYSLISANSIAKKLISLTPEHEGYSEDPEAYTSAANDIKLMLNQFSQKASTPSDKTYIPDTLTQKYLAMISSEQRRTRMNAYSEIQDQWLNQQALFDTLNDLILSSYNDDLTKQQLDELEEQIETIANAGLKEYKPTLVKITETATSTELQNFTSKQLKVLNSQALTSDVIHQPLPEDMNLSWKKHQLYNMATSEEKDLQRLAAKKIYRDYPKDKVLLDVLSEQLDQALIRGYNAELRNDFHAWICRILGTSGDTKYKPQLEYLAQNAAHRKVRNFAETYADEL